MSGVYIHVPFCKKKCKYCAFYSTTILENVDVFVESLCREICLRKDYIHDNVETIYFGGGTPSLLQHSHLQRILKTIKDNFDVVAEPEMTIECNPRDLNKEKIDELLQLGFNRLSIGIQSFDNKSLNLLGRDHDLEHIYSAVEAVKDSGFHNFNLDIIYGLPGQAEEDLVYDLQELVKIKPQHISAYTLSIEKSTPLFISVENGTLSSLSDDITAEYYLRVNDMLERYGYEHYEVSNYCQSGYESKHNSIYWDVTRAYVGFGPAAHSYDLESRQWNVASVDDYITSICTGVVPATIEWLNKQQRLYEYVLTSLRTKKGCDVKILESNFDFKIKTSIVDFLLKRELAHVNEKVITLTAKGFLYLDKIVREILL